VCFLAWVPSRTAEGVHARAVAPPRPFEAFVEMREMLVMRMQRLHGLAAYRGVHIREEPKLAEGRELLGSLIDKMDACIKNKTARVTKLKT
jgi:hypothetical protein